MSSTAFARFWHVDLTRECFLGHLDQDDLQKMRLVSKGIAATLAPVLFKKITIKFNATCFARKSRIDALARIGGLVRTVTFSMQHSDDTFLPPLLDPDTLQELTFTYEPQIHTSRPVCSSSDTLSPKYGSWELSDLLVRQYPLLFHAATNIPSFIRAISTMPFLRHLRISCPNKSLSQISRRDIVDYALISLRIAVEQANPKFLETLSLDPIHPTSLYYLRPQLSIGTSPNSTRVWRRIKTINMIMDSSDHVFVRPDLQAGSLKILHTYLGVFTALENLDFTWTGHKGPCPLSLDTEPCTTAPSSLDYLSDNFNLSSSPPSLSSSPSSTRSSQSSYFEPFTARKVSQSTTVRGLKFLRLRSMRLRNSVLDATQASSFIHKHRKTLTEFKFESCHLRSGSWDDALSPLTKMSRSDSWKEKQYKHSSLSHSSDKSAEDTSNQQSTLPSRPTVPMSQPHKWNEILEVPLILSPSDELPDLQLAIRDRLWLPGDTLGAYHEDEYDLSCLSGIGVNASPTKRGVRALRRIGRKIGVMGGLRHVREEDEIMAVDGVRKLLGVRDGSSRLMW